MSDDDEQAVTAYLMKKKFKIPLTHPRYEQKILAARTAAFKKYRRDGMIRSSSWSIEEQLKRWYELIKDWEADRDKEAGGTSIIRRESRSMQGTVEAMKAVIPCIKKGCLQDPFPLQKMYLETKVQPITGLQV
jgi:hypothetical protein